MSVGQVCHSTDDTWYLAQLKPGGLDRAITNLERQGFETFMPRREETHRRAGQWSTRLKPLFSGYLFVKVPADKRHYRSINGTYGVSRLVALEAGRPTRVSAALIDALRNRTSEDGLLQPLADLKAGDRVKVVSGPLLGELAEIEAIPEDGRIYVLLDLMGRCVKTELAAQDLEIA